MCVHNVSFVWRRGLGSPLQVALTVVESLGTLFVLQNDATKNGVRYVRIGRDTFTASVCTHNAVLYNTKDPTPHDNTTQYDAVFSEIAQTRCPTNRRGFRNGTSLHYTHGAITYVLGSWSALTAVNYTGS